MRVLLVAPLLIPLLTAILSILFWKKRLMQRRLSITGSIALLVVTVVLLYRIQHEGIQAVQIGNWPAPFGITVVADLLSAIMLVLGAVIGLAVNVYATATVDARREVFGFYPLLQVLLMGVSGAFVTGDLFNLYVWFEVMLISSFVLLALGGERPQLEGAFKYVTLNLISSALFLAAVGLLYGATGTLNMADLALKVRDAGEPALLSAIAMLFLTAFGIKAAVFPLFFWLPASYHTPPAAVSAVFAGLLTKVGVYALIRVFTLIFVHDVAYTHTVLLIIAGLTMVTGVLGAAVQNDFRRILSFHIVSQIGYMIMGLGLFTTLALAGSVFYIIHHIIVKTNLFLISGIVERMSGTYDLKKLGGVYRASPLLSALFLIPAFSLAGLPPFSGFFAKLFLLRAGLDVSSYTIVAVALAVGFMTLFSMMKIWNEAFWKPAESGAGPAKPKGAKVWGPVMALAALTVAIGLAVEPVYRISEDAARQLADPAHYIQAVLGDRKQ